MHQEVSWSARIALYIPSVILIFFLPSASDPFNLPKLVLLAILALGLVFSIDIRTLLYAKTRVGILLVLFSLTVLISGTLSYPNFVRSLLGAPSRNNGILYYLIAVLVAFILYSSAQSSAFNRLASKIFWTTSLVFMTYGVIQFFNLDPIPWQNPYNRIIGTVGNPNFSSVIFASIFAVSLTLILFQPVKSSRKSVIFTYSVLLVAALLVWSTNSLQGLILIAISLSLVLLRRILIKRSNRVKLAGLSTVFFVFTFLAFSFAGMGPFGSILYQYTLNLRLNYMIIGLKAISEKPVFGWGSDRYLDSYLQLRSPEFVQLRGLQLIADTPHSVPIQIGVSFGVIALVLFSFISLFTLTFAIRAIVVSKETDVFTLCTSLLYVMFFFQSLISIEQIGIGIIQWCLMGIVLQRVSSFVEVIKQSKLKPKVVSTRLWVKQVSFIVMTLALIPAILVFREDRTWSDLISLQGLTGDDKSYVTSQVEGLTSFTLDQPRKVGALAKTLQASGNSGLLYELVDRVYERNPRDAFAVQLKIAQERQKGEIGAARDNYRLLVELDPQDWRIWLEKANLEIELRDTISARESLRQVILLAPNSPEAEAAKSLLTRL